MNWRDIFKLWRDWRKPKFVWRDHIPKSVISDPDIIRDLTELLLFSRRKNMDSVHRRLYYYESEYTPITIKLERQKLKSLPVPSGRLIMDFDHSLLKDWRDQNEKI